MSNFLQICKDVNTLVGTQGEFLSVVDPTGYQEEIATTVNKVYLEVQLKRADWKWMRRVATFNTIPTLTTYLVTDPTIFPENDFGTWKLENVYLEDVLLPYKNYDRMLLDPPLVGSVYPSYFTIKPWDSSFILPSPSGTYKVDAHYFKSPHKLVKNTDEPILPPKFHDLLVYKASERIPSFVGNYSLEATYREQATIMMNQMMRDEVPAKRMTAPRFL